MIRKWMWICLFTIVVIATAASGQNCGNQADGSYPMYEGACLPQYYQCVSGYQYNMTCANSLVFNWTTGNCDYPANVEGCSIDNLDGTSCHDKQGYPVDGISFTYASNCSEGYYYECSNGVATERNCGSGRVFDVTVQMCVDASQDSDCGSNSIDRETTTKHPDSAGTTTPSVAPESTTPSGPIATEPETTSNPDITAPGTQESTGETTQAGVTDSTTSESPAYTSEDTTVAKPDETTADASTTAGNLVTGDPSFSPSTSPPTTHAPTPGEQETTPEVTNTTPDVIIPSSTTDGSTPTTTPKSTTPADGIKGNTYVGFVIDNTYSMAYEVEAVTDWLSNCINGANPSCGDSPTGGWITISFNDPMTTPVIGPTLDGQEILNEMQNYYVYGGGDCPEMAMDGLSKVANVVPDENGGCKIYLFTDATAKDQARAPDVTTFLNQKGCVLIPVLTGCCGDCPSPCSTVNEAYCEQHVIDNTVTSKRTQKSSGVYSGTDRTVFYEIAESTDGNINVINKPASSYDMVLFLEEELTMGFCPSNSTAGPSPGGYECEENCLAKGMCWDKSVSKCYCRHYCDTTPIEPGRSQCEGAQYVYCDPAIREQVIPDKQDCASYFTCQYGTLDHSTCVNGQIFSESSPTHCDYPKAVKPPCGTLGESPK